MDILIENNYEGMMIREVLKVKLGYSVNLIKKLKFSEDGILVNGKWVTVRYVLQRGDVLSLATEDKAEDVSPYIIPVDLPLEVVYEDEYITAINKPYNMPSHPSLGHKLDTVANALAHRYRDKVYVFRPINRLDRDTSGCMLTANTKDAAYKMYRAMVEGKICKTYIAVTDGVPEKKEGVLRSYMHRKEGSIILREETTEDAPDAKIAVTLYKVLAENGKNAIVMASPITGRTHQIRLHLMGIGCPIVGDSLYYAESEHIERHALHSWRTTFPHPESGEEITAISPTPEDIAGLISAVGLELPPEEELLKIHLEE
ncbi:MAG: RluA family pseudouridine synthase [Clostridia bacterium]|nr:RluA family pseudouridine synthase [Clostridia bacterium]